MNLILTSFGITENDAAIEETPSLFYRMPPVRLRASTRHFEPDYAALLLCEKLLMDETSFVMLIEKPNPLYSKTSETISALYGEGLIELVDFGRILASNQRLLEKMLENDLEMLDSWIEPLKESINIWSGFARRIGGSDTLSLHARHVLHNMQIGSGLPYKLTIDESKLAELSEAFKDNKRLEADLMDQLVLEAFESSRKRKKAIYRKALRETLRSYLAYVNANIVLANELGVGFYDWADMSPLYRRKFLSVGRDSPESSQNVAEAHKLFEMSFPEFAITNPSILIKILRDKRVSDLRQLVSDAVEGKVAFDNEFARSILKEVLGIERRAARYRNIVSYLTLPLDFVPWIGTVAQKAVEEGVGMLVERKLKEKHRWFYMLSEVTEAKQ